MELAGKVALVTGAGEGIGRAIALRLAQEGANIIVVDIDMEMAEITAKKIKNLGREAAAERADVSVSEQVMAVVESGLKRFGTIDILVNNAGIGGSAILVKDLPEEAWDRGMAVNLRGVFNFCKAVAPIMSGKGYGKIVNIASLAARRMSKLGGADYTASKYGVIGFSRHLAFELAAYGINVNVVCPGATLTPLVESKTSEDFRQRMGEQVPLGRWITPEEQAEAVLFLVSERSAMITGVALDVDGGQKLGVASDYKEDVQRRTENSARNLEAYQKNRRQTE